jgi:hypothetical protein
VNAALVQRVAARLDRARAAPAVAHRREQLRHLRRAGRGHVRLAAGAAVVDLHRADHAAAAVHHAEQVADEVRRRRLAVGPGDGEHFHLLGRVAVEGVGQDRGGRPRIPHADRRHGALASGACGDHRDRAAPDGVVDELLPVRLRPRAGDEQVARLDQPGVLADRSDFGVGDAGEGKVRVELLQQAVQEHGKRPSFPVRTWLVTQCPDF